MSKIPSVNPIFTINNPKSNDFPMIFGSDPSSTIQQSGKFIQIHDTISNSSKFIHLDDSYKQIVSIGTDPGRRFLAIAQYESGVYKVHLFFLKPLQKVAVLYVQDSLPLPKHVVGLTISNDGKYVVFQTGAPDYFVVAWQIPQTLTDWFQNPVGSINPISQPKSLHNFKVQREVTNLKFHRSKNDLFCIFGPGLYTMMNVSDSCIRIQSPMNVKKIINKFDCVYQDGQYSFLLSSDVSEILILKEESLVSFIPNEVVLSNRCHIRTTQRQEPTYKLIRNHPEGVIGKDERIVKLASLQQKILVLGSNKGRILVFKIDKLDESIESVIQRQTAPCKTVNQLVITVCEVSLVMSILMPSESPIISIDVNSKGSLLIQQNNGQSFITNKFLPSKIDEIIKISLRVQAQKQEANQFLFQNLVVLNAFDSIAKLKELIKSPNCLKLQSEELYQLNQTNSMNKINIIGSEDLDALDQALFSDPNNWPEFLFSTSTLNPFTPWIQATSSILTAIDNVLVNSQQFKPYIQFQGYYTGKPFLTDSNIKITALDVSDEAGILAFGDENGMIKIFSTVKFQAVADFQFRMPTRSKIYQPAQDDLEEQKQPNNSFLDALTTQRTQMTQFTHTEEAAPIYEQPKLDLPDEYDFSGREYEISYLKLHPTGIHLIAAVSTKDPKYQSYVNCIVIMHLVQQDVEIASIIEIEDKIIQIQTDQTGNFFYVLTRQFLHVFTFYELQNVSKIALKQRISFVNQVHNQLFSAESQHKMKAQTGLNGVPTHFEISQNSGLAAVSFSDGDLCVFNVFTSSVEYKFLAQANKFIVHFRMIRSTEMSPEMQEFEAQLVENGSKIALMLILATYNDGSVQILNMEKPVQNITQSGNLSGNFKQNLSFLIPGGQQISEWFRVQGSAGTSSDCLIEAMMQNSEQKTFSKDLAILGGDKGFIQIFSTDMRDQQPYQIQLHGCGIKFMRLVRETLLVSISEDNQVIISQLKYGNVGFVQKPVPKAIIAQTQIIRSKPLQNALDLLLFELLSKFFLLKSEGQKSMSVIKNDCDVLIQKWFNDFQSAKREALTTLTEQTEKLQNLTFKTQNSQQSHTQKLTSLSDELQNSYEEQLSRLKNERDTLQKRRIQQLEARNLAEQNYKLETQQMIEKEQQITDQRVNELKSQYKSLQQDQQDLQQISAEKLNSASSQLEQEITILRKNVEVSIKTESKQVLDLRFQHKQMEQTYNKLLAEFQSAKANLADYKNQVQEINKKYQFQLDQKDRVQNDIFDRENAEINKKGTIGQMLGEKDDLEKLKQLLNQRVGDLKQCVAPRDDQISDLQTQIADMDQELLKDALKQKQAELVINDLKLRKTSFKQENDSLLQKIIHSEHEMKELLSDLSNFAELYAKKMNIKMNSTFLQQVTNMKIPISIDKTHRDFINSLKIIYGKHINPEFALSIKARTQDSDIVQQLIGTEQIITKNSSKNTEELGVARQREYLEKSVATLQKSLERRREQLNQAIEQSRTQSSTLLSFSNLMRRENKVLQQKLRAAKLELMKKKKDLNILEDQMFGDALTLILNEQEGDEATSNKSASDIGLDDVQLDNYLDNNFPINDDSQSIPQRSALPPGVPRPPSRQ